ncbi:DUF2505 domain-containing protein [Nakamurella sp. A5-74]|uniref:DUF2505 domain-containing protein n=1 Tax=Nakamurella sp. A5-74 TaxID=3158264 RepID=A0AAU8DN48_9ACTN
MSTALHVVQHYPAAPSAVMAKFADRAFLDGRLQAAGGLEPSVNELSGSPAEGLILSMQQSIPASALPSMVASLIPGDPVTIRTEKWRAEGAGFLADFDVVIKGAPASLKGTMTLSPAGTGSTLTVDGSASVPIPLFGGKIESVIVEQVEQLLVAEEKYTAAAL